MGSGGSPFNLTGDALMPQLPTITVVMPWDIFGFIAGARITLISSWVCTSIKPGASASPSASTTTRVRNPREGPMARIRSPHNATSITSEPGPLPSITLALRINVSQLGIIASQLYRLCTLRRQDCNVLVYAMYIAYILAKLLCPVATH